MSDPYRISLLGKVQSLEILSNNVSPLKLTTIQIQLGLEIPAVTVYIPAQLIIQRYLEALRSTLMYRYYQSMH